MEAAVDTGNGARDLLRLLLALSMGGACISPLTCLHALCAVACSGFANHLHNLATPVVCVHIEA